MTTLILTVPDAGADTKDIEQLIDDMRDYDMAPSLQTSPTWFASIILIAQSRPGDEVRRIAYALAMHALEQHPPIAPDAWEVKAAQAVRRLAPVAAPEAGEDR